MKYLAGFLLGLLSSCLLLGIFSSWFRFPEIMGPDEFQKALFSKSLDYHKVTRYYGSDERFDYFNVFPARWFKVIKENSFLLNPKERFSFDNWKESKQMVLKYWIINIDQEKKNNFSFYFLDGTYTVKNILELKRNYYALSPFEKEDAQKNQSIVDIYYKSIEVGEFAVY